MRTIVRFLIFTFIAISAIRTAPTSAASPQLVVALYPYVPRVEQFQKAIRAAWSSVQPTVPLVFMDAAHWDGGYSMDPPPGADVFVFDAMYFEYFRARGWLSALSPGEVQGLDDFVPYAINGVRVGASYYAIPQLGCANILFYQKNDAALANAKTLTQVQSALSQCTYTSEIPPDRRGLMIDMAGKTTNGTLYLDSAHAITGQYPLPLPQNPAQLNANAVANMRRLLAMASYENGTADDLNDPYQRGEWFSRGWGRAVVGFTEYMSDMSDETRRNIAFKVMPLSDAPNPPLFYADVIGVNTTTTSRGTRALAVQLANIMASSATMTASIGPDPQNPGPQYLMATRPSVFQTLGATFPIYKDMYALVATGQPVMFKLDSSSREWFSSDMPATIRSAARQNYSCGCDYRSVQYISNNSAAPAICQSTCASYGGWNGQWTNEYPAAQGWSVCGCRTCPNQTSSGGQSRTDNAPSQTNPATNRVR